jgi:hypothetical protein
LLDAMVFQGDDRLILARAETSDPTVPPYGGTDPGRYPRHAAIYDLRGAEPTKPIRVLRDFNIFMRSAALSPDGKTLVLDGLAGPDKERSERSITAFDVATDRRLWSHRSRLPLNSGATLGFDRTGRFIGASFASDDDKGHVLIEVSSGNILEHLRNAPPYVVDAGGVALSYGWVRDYVCGLFLGHRVDPVLHIDTLAVPFSEIKSFGRDGSSFVCSNREPLSPVIVNLAEVNRRLSEVGLGW